VEVFQEEDTVQSVWRNVWRICVGMQNFFQCRTKDKAELRSFLTENSLRYPAREPVLLNGMGIILLTGDAIYLQRPCSKCYGNTVWIICFKSRIINKIRWMHWRFALPKNDSAHKRSQSKKTQDYPEIMVEHRRCSLPSKSVRLGGLSDSDPSGLSWGDVWWREDLARASVLGYESRSVEKAWQLLQNRLDSR
jgi:hypothetical protein